MLFLLYLQMKRVKDFTIIDKIGKGGFAKVYKATKGKQEETYALKKIERNDENTERYIQGELEIVQERLKHRNIVQIFEYFRDGNIYIVMEYCEMGDLNAYLVQVKPDINQRIVFMTHMALGVNYLQDSNVVVGKFIFSMIDIKPENRPQMDFVLMKISEIKVKHELHPAIKDLQNQNDELRQTQREKNEANEVKFRELYKIIEELQRQKPKSLLQGKEIREDSVRKKFNINSNTNIKNIKMKRLLLYNDLK